MPMYYNKTRGPLAVSLSSGKSAVVGPKGWIEIDAADAGSPDVISLLDRQYLVLSPAEKAALAAPAPVPVPVEAPVVPPPISVEVAKAKIPDEKAEDRKKK